MTEERFKEILNTLDRNEIDHNRSCIRQKDLLDAEMKGYSEATRDTIKYLECNQKWFLGDEKHTEDVRVDRKYEK